MVCIVAYLISAYICKLHCASHLLDPHCCHVQDPFNFSPFCVISWVTLNSNPLLQPLSQAPTRKGSDYCIDCIIITRHSHRLSRSGICAENIATAPLTHIQNHFDDFIRDHSIYHESVKPLPISLSLSHYFASVSLYSPRYSTRTCIFLSLYSSVTESRYESQLQVECHNSARSSPEQTDFGGHLCTETVVPTCLLLQEKRKRRKKRKPKCGVTGTQQQWTSSVRESKTPQEASDDNNQVITYAIPYILAIFASI